MKTFSSKSKSRITIKNLVFLMVISVLVVSSCKTTKEASAPEQKVQLVENDSIEESDSTEYELVVLDPGFESWLATQPPKEYHSQRFYENRNTRYVIEWNQRHDSPLRYGDFYQTRIDYDPHIDYGLELNYKLYYYFRYIEKEYGIKLIESFN